MSYTWGDLAPATSRFAGRLTDSQPGNSQNPLWNLVNRVAVPIAGARLDVESPITREIYHTLSDLNGNFALTDIPLGIYVVHIDGGSGGREYEPTSLLFQLSRRANLNTLDIIRREPSGGSCGGTYLELQPERRAN